MDRSSVYRNCSFLLAGLILLVYSGCKKEEFPTGTVRDINGNKYKTVTIGTQEWMAGNLRTTKYNDGSPVPQSIGDPEWDALSTGAYCIFANTQIMTTTHGFLYNWFAAVSTKLCPEGWHVPTMDDWSTLLDFLGGEEVAAAKLKETGSSNWIETKPETTNETGFTALPGGIRLTGGKYLDLGYKGHWWSTAEYGSLGGREVQMAGNSNAVEINTSSKRAGLSVRCVRD